MEFLQLKYFFNAAQTENFSKTANTFSVPASAISQSFQRLENELGTALFERRKNRVILNEEGKIFYQTVRQMNSILSDVNKQLADSSRNSCGTNHLCFLGSESLSDKNRFPFFRYAD